jgi:hypothetical protein
LSLLHFRVVEVQKTWVLFSPNYYYSRREREEGRGKREEAIGNREWAIKRYNRSLAKSIIMIYNERLLQLIFLADLTDGLPSRKNEGDW